MEATEIEPSMNKNRHCPLSQSKKVHSMGLLDYLSWVADSDDYETPLLLPPIQRGFVWKPKQIQDLWDSLLREMPIGAFLVRRFESGRAFAKTISDCNAKVEKIEKEGWHLLDGQQRTLAMLLGYPCGVEMKHKLWVDFNKDGYRNGTRFQFRVTTSYQPFGYLSNGGRLPLHERRNALELWKERKGLPNDQKIDYRSIFDDAITKPWVSKEKQESQEQLILPVSYIWDVSKAEEIIEKLNLELELTDEIFQRIQSFIHGLDKLKKQEVALIEAPVEVSVPDIEKEKTEQDFQTLLFERISRGGTQLSPDDLLFSMVKQEWPEAHNLVYDLQSIVGSLMKPTDFVMTAFRIASLLASDIADQSQPNPASFHKNLSTMLGSKSEPGELRKLIGLDDSSIKSRGTLANDFEQLKKVLKFRQDAQDDIGIPFALFPYLERPLLQVLLFWIHKTNASISESRIDIIRFSLFWMICRRDSKSAVKASEIAIAVIDENNGFFPFQEIYLQLTKKVEDRLSLFCPLVLDIKIPTKDEFRNPNKRGQCFFGSDGSDSGNSLYHQFVSRKHLLLWMQRHWVQEQYPDERMFLSGQDEDTVPYDYDHLVPQSNWSNFQGIERKLNNCKGFEDLWQRRLLGNSIGNYRVMDASENRSRGDEPLADLLNKRSDWENYVLDLDGDIKKYWESASPVGDGRRRWDDTRVLNFQWAVEMRVISLYKRFFIEADLQKLLADENHKNLPII